MKRILTLGLIGAALAAALVIAADAPAAVTLLNSYTLGDDDPGALPGQVGNPTTTDAAGGQHLARDGSPTYVGFPPPPASNLAMDFNGTNQRYAIGSVISSLVDNFGIEAWVQTDGTAGNVAIAYNGNTSTSGWGLFRIGGNYQGLFGGRAFVGSAPAQPGVWTHVAVVRDSGTSTLYLNGTPAGGTGTPPNPPAGAFAVGANPAGLAELFDGRIDQVRVFNFTAGQFNPLADLQLDAQFAHYRLGNSDPGAVPGGPGNATTVNETGGHNLAKSGSPTYGAYMTTDGPEVGMSFSGTSGEFYADSNVLSVARDNWILQARAQTLSTAGNAVVAYNGNTSNSGYGIFRIGGQWQGLFGGIAFVGGAPVDGDRWNDLALVREAGTTRLYVNGRLAGTSGATPNVPNGRFMVGGNAPGGGEVFNGQIDDVRLATFSGAFDPALFQPPTTEVRGHYELGEQDPGAAAGLPGNALTIDSAGNNNLARQGTQTYVSYLSNTGNELAMQFTGVAGEHYSTSPVITTARDNWILEARVKPDDTAGNGIVAYNGNTSTSGFGLFRFGSEWRGLFGGVAFVGSSAPVQLGRWNDVALVRFDGQTQLYVNGLPAGAATGATPHLPNGAFMVGGNPGNAGESLAGTIDDVRLALFNGPFDPAMLQPPSFEVMGYYRLGENDPGAAPGLPGNPQTVDAAGHLNLNKAGSPTYARSPMSPLSMAFTGTDGEVYSNAPVLTSERDNWVLEAWVNATDDTGVDIVAYHGNTSNSGFGLFRNGAEWQGLFGGIAVLDFDAPVELGEWANLALVRENGQTQLYLDGQITGPAYGNLPNLPAGAMMIGGNPLNPSEAFHGRIDEVRLSLFAGRFDPDTMLLYNTLAVPEPSSIILAIVALAVLGVWGGWRKSRTTRAR